MLKVLKDKETGEALVWYEPVRQEIRDEKGNLLDVVEVKVEVDVAVKGEEKKDVEEIELADEDLASFNRKIRDESESLSEVVTAKLSDWNRPDEILDFGGRVYLNPEGPKKVSVGPQARADDTDKRKVTKNV